MGSGKGYLCSYLSMRFNLQVLGSTPPAPTHMELWRETEKLKKFSKAYQKQNKATRKQTLDSGGMRENNTAETLKTVTALKTLLLRKRKALRLKQIPVLYQNKSPIFGLLQIILQNVH